MEHLIALCHSYLQGPCRGSGCRKSYSRCVVNKTRQENCTCNRPVRGGLAHKRELEVLIGRIGLDHLDGSLEDVRTIRLQEEHSLDLEIYSCEQLLIRDHIMAAI